MSWITSEDCSNHYKSSSNDNDSDISSNDISSHNHQVNNKNGQLNNNAKTHYNEYLQAIDVESVINNGNTSGERNKHEWPINACLIIGDSILQHLDESRLSKRNAPVKVRCFPGSNIEDMYSYICPLLRKNPAHIVLHVATNDAPYKSPDEILTDILKLKLFILDKLPNCDVIISQPITRYDNQRAKVTIRNLNAKLNLLKINMVDNSNIDFEQLGKRGLHLCNWGTSRLALNYMSLMRQF